MVAINFAIILASLRLSFRNVAFTLDQGLHVQIHRDNIRRRFEFNTNLVESYVKMLELNVSGKWSIDEKCVRIRVVHWIFTVMDTGTGFILSFDVYKKKMGYDARSLF